MSNLFLFALSLKQKKLEDFTEYEKLARWLEKISQELRDFYAKHKKIGALN